MLSRRMLAAGAAWTALGSMAGVRIAAAAEENPDGSPVVHLSTAEAYTSMPDKFRRKNTPNDWSRVNKFGLPPADCFIEGLTLQHDGSMYVVDIPFGRIFKISPNKEWSQIAEWEGEPNGMARHPDGRFFITDYKKGLLTFDPATNKLDTLVGRRDSESFKGLNDLTFALNGDLYFTDQGQTGMQDQTGRVYRLRTNGQLDALITTGISPNGIVLHPNEQVLFVCMTRDNSVWRVPLYPDGTTGKVGRFVSFHGPSGPDSLTIDSQGNLLVPHASLGAVFGVDPDGEIIARIRSPQGKMTTNAKVGGPDNKTLYFTESSTGTIYSAPWIAPARSQYANL